MEAVLTSLATQMSSLGLFLFLFHLYVLACVWKSCFTQSVTASGSMPCLGTPCHKHSAGPEYHPGCLTLLWVSPWRWSFVLSFSP